jgi:hypothetical protein
MRALALAASVMLTVGCNNSMAPSSVNVRVSGRVLGFATNVVMPGAAVAFGNVATVSDSVGSFTLIVPAIGPYDLMVNGAFVGASQVTGSTYRGDLLVDTGTCVSRYGTLADARTLTPVVGATVKFVGPGIDNSAVSGSDGWYRIDLGCPANGLVGFNTTELSVSHPNYVDPLQSIGRGVFGVRRLDFALQAR